MVRNKEIESIFRTLYRPLCLYALHYLGDTEAVEDVVQDSFIALWNSGERVENAKAWMYRAVRNRCIDHLRRNRASEMAGEAQEPLPRDLEGQISDEEVPQMPAYGKARRPELQGDSPGTRDCRAPRPQSHLAGAGDPSRRAQAHSAIHFFIFLMVLSAGCCVLEVYG